MNRERQGDLVLIGLFLLLVGLWIGIDYASKSHDRMVKQLWADEEAIIRAKEYTRSRNPEPPRAPAPAPQPGQRDA